MSVAVVVPWRAGCPHRERAWEFVQGLYAEHHPEWELIEAPAPAGEWCKGAALQPAIERCEAEIVIQADSDVWTDGLADAVAAVEAGAGWAIPHLLVHRLSEDGAAAVLDGEGWEGHRLAQRPYRGVVGGGFVVAPRTVLRAVPVDVRFKGWGQDDEAQALALKALIGMPWRGKAPLYHLWHPPQGRMSRRRGSRESWELRHRYARCKDDPAAMAVLVEEGRDACSTPKYASDVDPPFSVR